MKAASEEDDKTIEPTQAHVKPARRANQSADWARFLAGVTRGKTAAEFSANHIIYKQGEPAGAVFYLRHGKVKLAATSEHGKEAIVALLNAGEFFGEGCLAGQPLRIGTATALTDCLLDKIEKPLMTRMLHEQMDVSEMFVKHLLARNIRYEEDLLDQLLNSSEKRLARILLLLAHFGKDSKAEAVLPKVNQEHLAQMVGTTRSRVSHFMNKFRKDGFIDYNSNGELTVRNGLLSVVLGALSKKAAAKSASRPSAAARRPAAPKGSKTNGTPLPTTDYLSDEALASPGVTRH